MTVLTAIYLPGLLLFLRATRTVRLHEHDQVDPLTVAAQRLVMGRRASELGSFRVAVIDASSAVDLLAGADAWPTHDDASGFAEARVLLESLRARAADPTATLDVDDATQALEIAARIISPS